MSGKTSCDCLHGVACVTSVIHMQSKNVGKMLLETSLNDFEFAALLNNGTNLGKIHQGRWSSLPWLGLALHSQQLQSSINIAWYFFPIDQIHKTEILLILLGVLSGPWTRSNDFDCHPIRH